MKQKPNLYGMNLFGDDEISESVPRSQLQPPDEYADVKWSFTKHGVLKQCPRRFYYQYYGGNLHKAKWEVDKERLRELKLLVTREERTGQLLHLGIATYLRKAQSGKAMTADETVRWVLGRYRKDIEFSKRGLAGVELSTDSKAPRFQLEYLSEPGADVMCTEAGEEMVEGLERFFEAPVFAGVREMGMAIGSSIEKKFTHLTCVPFGVEGQVDLAHRADNGQMTIVDWKSGEYMWDGDESLQLAVYALWAQETHGCAPHALTVQKAFLGSDDLVTYPVSERQLSSARFAILQDADCFARMHNYGIEAVMEAFTPCAQEAVCRRCPFVSVCREGRECLS